MLLVKLLCLVTLGTVNACSDLSVLFNGCYEYYDLSYPFDNYTAYYVNLQRFVFTKQEAGYQDDGSWYAANVYLSSEHAGTHIDAPYHFSATGLKVGELPLERLIVPLVIIDVSDQVADDPNFVLQKYHLGNKLDANDGKPCIIIFKFGWSKYVYNRDKYMGLDANNRDYPNFPGIGAEVAEWIASEYPNVVGVGVDSASVDPGSATNEVPAHKTLLGAGLYLLENVDLSDYVPVGGCVALVLPMKIALGSGAPVRLVAACPTTRSKRQNKHT